MELRLVESLIDRTSISAKQTTEDLDKLLKKILKADLDMNENEVTVLANLSEV